MQIGVVQRPVGQNEHGPEPVQVCLVSRRNLEGGRLHFSKTFGTEPTPQERRNSRSGEQPVAAFTVSNLVPEGSGGRVQEKPRREARQDRGRFRLAFGPKIDMFGATIANLRLNKHPQFRGRTMPLIPRTQRESYRKLDPQGQYYRARRRSAVRSSFGGKLSPRQRNANYSDRHAAPFRRGQGDRSI